MRAAVQHQAKCRLKSGSTVDLDLLDISPGGAMVDCKRWGLTAGDRILVRLPGLAYQPGEVIWVEDERAGIAFESPLHEAVLANFMS
jgi:hypothetical protein